MSLSQMYLLIKPLSICQIGLVGIKKFIWELNSANLYIENS